LVVEVLAARPVFGETKVTRLVGGDVQVVMATARFLAREGPQRGQGLANCGLLAGFGFDPGNEREGFHAAGSTGLRFGAMPLVSGSPPGRRPAFPRHDNDAAIRSAAARGFGAAVMGRPMTSQFAPAASASRGDNVRFWSSAFSAPVRMPGVTS